MKKSNRREGHRKARAPDLLLKKFLQLCLGDPHCCFPGIYKQSEARGRETPLGRSLCLPDT